MFDTQRTSHTETPFAALASCLMTYFHGFLSVASLNGGFQSSGFGLE